MKSITPLAAEAVRAAAHASGFPLVGLARADALDPGPLQRWLAAGYAADMTWMARRIDERLDPRKVLSGAETVIALGIPYARSDAAGPSPIARYARGRDYHYAHRDRLKALRKRLLELDADIDTYACVDTGVAMEKVWAERAGLGWIGKNGCLISPTWGSWITLSVMFVDRSVATYDESHANLCGDCTLCLRGCPTKAFPSPGVVDAARCISYQTIENSGPIPDELRPKMRGHVFGCDVCQEVCPFNRRSLPEGDSRFAPRPIGKMSAEDLAALDEPEWNRLSPGSALARPGYHAIRRNAVLALGASARLSARGLVERLADDPDPLVSEAARWTLAEEAGAREEPSGEFGDESGKA